MRRLLRWWRGFREEECNRCGHPRRMHVGLLGGYSYCFGEVVEYFVEWDGSKAPYVLPCSCYGYTYIAPTPRRVP